LSVKKPIWFIFAYGAGSSFEKHLETNRGQKFIDLTGTYFKNNAPASEITKELAIGSPPYEITAKKTTYCYTYHDLGEQLDGKHHIVEEDIENGTDMLHHIVVYQCPDKEDMEPGKVVCNFYREKGE
jgi:hypothetical protein